MYKFTKKIGKYVFNAPSKNGKSKYDVHDYKTGKFIARFGAIGYEQYFDKLGYYSKYNHNDKERRRLYHLRHKKNVGIAGRLASYYLW